VICFFATDLHGQLKRYSKLLAAIIAERPDAVFLGGDLLPHHGNLQPGELSDFVLDYLRPAFHQIQQALGENSPQVFLILGNDDPKCEQQKFVDGERLGLWRYMHGRRASLADWQVCGYSCVPPTPFLLKDWERYDVSRYIPVGCVSPEEGRRTVEIAEQEIKWGTIKKDLAELAIDASLDRTILLLHTPPHETPLDRAALDGKTCEHVPFDVHVGSIAVRRFIEERQPMLTLHGHVHESARITGEWKIRIGRTVCINAAHDGPELALVRFSPESPFEATRELL
jgi:Icc-related predicted phosphoesterase